MSASRYGVHLTKEEVEALVAPHPASVSLVEAWLCHHSIDVSSFHRSTAGDWLTVKVPVANAERLLGTKYNVYYHPVSDIHVVRTLSFSLPRVLHDHVDLVTPTTYFGSIRAMSPTHFLDPAADSDNDAPNITVAILMDLYQTVGYTPSTNDLNQLGVAGYLEEYANRVDLQVHTA